MIILSIYGCCGWVPQDDWLHSAGASLWNGLYHVASISEERLTRVKYDGSYPEKSINYVLKAGKVSKEDVDIIVYVGSIHAAFRLHSIEKILKTEFPNADFETVDHHMAHAAAVFYGNGLREANILTFDGAGSSFVSGNCADCVEHETGFFGIGSGYGITIVDHFLNGKRYQGFFSLGEAYNYYSREVYRMLEPEKALSFTNPFLFMETAPGKIMGIAAYGTHEKVDLPDQFVLEDDHGRFPKLFWRNAIDQNTLRRYDPRDIAAWIQHQFETGIINYLEEIRATGFEFAPHLCLAGGCALNVLANTAVDRTNLFEGVYVYPASNDTGLCFGGGAWAVFKHMSDYPLTPMMSADTGISYESSYKKAIKKYDVEVEDMSLEELAQVIADGGVVGFFDVKHGSEFGPRALGFRSILADPRREDIKDYINANIKYREWWRPYAPVVVMEEFGKYFDIPCESEYMMFSGKVLVDNLPGITHEDGTARVQTVLEDEDAELWYLLQEFKKITGIPVLLNTSFNLGDEPIVETPENAINTFLRSNLDGLYMGGKYITKPQTVLAKS